MVMRIEVHTKKRSIQVFKLLGSILGGPTVEASLLFLPLFFCRIHMMVEMHKRSFAGM